MTYFQPPAKAPPAASRNGAGSTSTAYRPWNSRTSTFRQAVPHPAASIPSGTNSTPTCL
jgi:hypothetical protein